MNTALHKRGNDYWVCACIQLLVNTLSAALRTHTQTKISNTCVYNYSITLPEICANSAWDKFSNWPH